LGHNGSYQLEQFKSLFADTPGLEFITRPPTDTLILGGGGAQSIYSEERLFSTSVSSGFLPFGTNHHLQVEGALDLSEFAEVTHLGLLTIYAVRPTQLTEHEFLREKAEFYRRVRWNSELNCPDTNGLRDLVGVHVRHGDNLNDRRKVKSGLLTPLEAFWEQMSQWPEQMRFLLCTDNWKAVEPLVDQFKERIARPPRKATGIQQALLEMRMLSRTKEIIGSTCSTFSYEAAFMGPTPIHLWSRGGWRRFDPLSFMPVSSTVSPMGFGHRNRVLQSP
jgi:hypothetical protein